MRAFVSVVALTAAAALCVVSHAGAATVSLTFLEHQPGDRYAAAEARYRLDVADPDGERNELTIERTGVVRAGGGALTAGPGCAATAPGEVTCTPASVKGAGGVVSQTIVDVGAGDDAVVSRRPATLRGGAGADRLVLDGVSGVLDGGPGADALVGPARGADPWAPAATVDYGGRAEGVRVTPDVGGADDGAPGEGDEVTGGVGAVTGGSGADELHGSPHAPTTVVGGAGDDRLVSGAGGTLQGGPGADVLLGGPGAEQLDGGPGADLLRGGAGSDRATYAQAPGPVRVTLDDQPGDGAAGEGDDVGGDVESVDGTSGADVLVGGPAANDLVGGPGDDRLDGGPGDDRLAGYEGDDVLRGGDGNDVLDDDLDDDMLATHGDDLDGGAGRDRLLTGGVDRVAVRDGEVDVVDCGPKDAGHHGALIADARDQAIGCAPRMGWRSDGKLDRRERVRFVVTCPRASALRCRGRVVLFARREAGRAAVDVAPGRRQTVRIRLPRRVAREARRRPSGMELGITVETVRPSPRSVLRQPGFHDRVRVRGRGRVG